MIQQVWKRLTGQKSTSRKVQESLPDIATLAVWVARFGFGARGFVYLSVGLIMLLAALDLAGRPVSTAGVTPMLLDQPMGRVWVAAVGAGLVCFSVWRVLQSIFDADRQGRSSDAIRVRAGQATSALVYLALGITAFAVLVKSHPEAGADLAENRQRAAWLLQLPLGGLALMGVGAAVLWVGGLNVWKAATEDFGNALACSPELCRKVTPLARIGHVARGLSYAPAALLIMLAGWRNRASDVPSFGSALDALRDQPGGPILLSLTAAGLMAFGAFSMIEARFRRIKPPKDLSV